MFRVVAIKPLTDYRIWIRFSDGAEGEVSLAHLAGRGVFAPWKEPGVFEQVHITPAGAIAWSDEMEICADSLYLRLTGKAPETVFPNLRMAVGA